MNSLNKTERLIFVGGCPRSGTTLVQNMLDSHPDIFGGPEFLHLEDLIRFRKILRSSISKGWIDLFCSYDSLDDHLRTLIQDLFLPLADEHGCAYMSEKSPMNVLVLSELIELFPQSRFIHVIRDPRAIVSSMQDVCKRAKQKGLDIPSFTASIGSSIAYTSRCFHAGFEAARRFPNKVLTITYESLVKDPESASRDICQYLSIPWNRQMTAPQEVKHIGEKAITANSGEIWYDLKSYYQDPHDKNIAKWQSRLTPFQQIRVARAFKKFSELRDLGYDFSADSLSPAKRLVLTSAVSLMAFGEKVYGLLLSLGRKTLRRIPMWS